MIFNGHTLDSISELDEIRMAQITTMYADGIIGNENIIQLLGTLVNGVFNYIRPPNATPYKLSNIIGASYDYLYPPIPQDQQATAASNNLLLFMSQAPGFKPSNFGLSNG